MSQAIYPVPVLTLPQKKALSAVSLSLPQRGTEPDVESKNPSPCSNSGGHHSTGFPLSSTNVLNRTTKYVSPTPTADATFARISASEVTGGPADTGVDRVGSCVLG